MGSFRILSISTLKHNPDIPQYPKMQDQIARLEVLNALAIMKYPQAQAALKQFLKEQNWEVKGLASTVLLGEGDDEVLDMMRTLLGDADPKVHMQAALVLSLWGKDEAAIAVLQAGYPKVDRDTKERILEGLGRIGSPTTIPFLMQIMPEAPQSLRIIAACALIQCINH